MTGKPSRGRGLQLIAAFKLLKGFALLAVGIGALKLVHKDVAALVEHWINVFQVDPHNHFIDKLLEKLAVLDDRRLKELSVGTFLYAAIFFTEGIGLALLKRWAEYFTIITTASLLPIEIYELVKRASLGRGFALLINLAVVAYLVRELRRTSAPIVDKGVVQPPRMPFDIIGGILWGGGVTVAGYFLGNVPFIHQNLEKIVLAILFVSMLPAFIATTRAYLKRRRAAKDDEDELTVAD